MCRQIAAPQPIGQQPAAAHSSPSCALCTRQRAAGAWMSHWTHRQPGPSRRPVPMVPGVWDLGPGRAQTTPLSTAPCSLVDHGSRRPQEDNRAHRALWVTEPPCRQRAAGGGQCTGPPGRRGGCCRRGAEPAAFFGEKRQKRTWDNMRNVRLNGQQSQNGAGRENRARCTSSGQGGTPGAAPCIGAVPKSHLWSSDMSHRRQ